MHVKPLVCSLVLIVLSVALLGCTGGGTRRRSAPTTERLGYVLNKHLISIDAEFNPETGYIIPGYTALTVALANKSMRPFRLRPDKDRWQVRDRKGRWHKGINEIQYEAQEAWDRLHPEARRLMEYPVMVPPGYTQTFEIFFKGDLNLAGFRAIRHRNTISGKTYTFTRY